MKVAYIESGMNIVFYGNSYHKIFIGSLVDMPSHAKLSTSDCVEFALITRDYPRAFKRLFSSVLRAWFVPNVYLWIPCSSACIYQLILLSAFPKVFVYSDGLADIVDQPPLLFRAVFFAIGRKPYTLSSISEYVHLVRSHIQAQPQGSTGYLSESFVLLNLKYPRYLSRATASILLVSIVEYIQTLSSTLKAKIVVSSHRLFVAGLSPQSLKELHSCHALFDDRPIIDLIRSPLCRCLVSLPSGVIADALALENPSPIILIDPRFRIKDPSALTRMSTYINMLHSFAPTIISVASL